MGRTSWNAQGELVDYISFAGFLSHYIHNLDPQALSSSVDGPGSSHATPLSPIPSHTCASYDPTEPNGGMTLLWGGYSYGALVASSLPCTEAIISHFDHPATGSAAAEIRLRAHTLSSLWNKQAMLDSRERCSLHGDTPATSPRPPRSPRHRTSMTYGGDDGEPGTNRLSRDSRRSIDAVRRSLDRSTRKLWLKRSSDERLSSLLPEDRREGLSEESQGRLEPVRLHVRHTQYLLISPLLPPASTLVTLFRKLAWSRRPSQLSTPPDGMDSTPPVSDERTDRLTRCSTLAIYGDKDFFTARNKLRKWAAQLSSVPQSRFQSVEVAGAGHFWHEDHATAHMKQAIRDWMAGLSDDDGAVVATTLSDLPNGEPSSVRS